MATGLEGLRLCAEVCTRAGVKLSGTPDVEGSRAAFVLWRVI